MVTGNYSQIPLGRRKKHVTLQCCLRKVPHGALDSVTYLKTIKVPYRSLQLPDKRL